jgi:sugar/nucleoside kinase (ribokinase family)
LFDVLGIGAFSVDYLSVVDHYPLEDEKVEVCGLDIQGGGNIATACVAIARLGGIACYHGIIGRDENTEIILNEFRREGVNVQHIRTKEGKNPIALVIISKQKSSRTILYSKKDVPDFGAVEVDSELVKKSRVLLIDLYHEHASLKASETAGKYGIPVVLDAERVTPLAAAILGKTTYAIVSRSFAFTYTESHVTADPQQVLQILAQRSVCPCITLGKDGALFFDRNKNEILFQKAFGIDVSDTTGAGDVFHGAFAFFLSKGYSHVDILHHASACAALKCREIGGRKGIPSMKELKYFVKEPES